MRSEGPGLVELLTQLTKAFQKRTSEEVLGMKLRQYLALSKVLAHPGMSQQDLAEMLLYDANAVVLLLNELEDLGYSIRRRDTEDRRRHIVAVTDKGRRALERAEKRRASIEDDLLQGLTAEDKTALRSLLTRALDSLLQVAP
jgi:DNA-binding MarR family transcriptional regulator